VVLNFCRSVYIIKKNKKKHSYILKFRYFLIEESYNISTHLSYPSDGDGISTTNSLQTIPDIDKRVAAVGKVDDGVKPTTLAVGMYE
jgi:hypothetical protein